RQNDLLQAQHKRENMLLEEKREFQENQLINKSVYRQREARARSLTPSAQITQRRLDALNALDKGETLSPAQKELLGKKEERYTATDVLKQMTDFGARRFEELSDPQKQLIRQMASKTNGSVMIESVDIPAKRSGNFDIGKPNIPARTEEKLVFPSNRQSQTKPLGIGTRPAAVEEITGASVQKREKGETIADYLKRTRK
ncbi:MAG: hypothetical protein U9P49_11210, partial [Thermodesulfobacteriota bacterium]|nr:hypothetical protein [Thermodesulfobacteriota bacterium]